MYGKPSRGPGFSESDSVRVTKFHLKNPIRSGGAAGRQDVLINTGSICALRPARTCDLKSFPAFGGGPNLLRLLLLLLRGHWEGKDWTNKETISMRLSALWGVQNTGDQEVPLLSCFCQRLWGLKVLLVQRGLCVCVLFFLDVILYGGARETARERYRAIKFGVINYNHKKRMGNMFWLFTHRRQWTDASGTRGK